MTSFFPYADFYNKEYYKKYVLSQRNIKTLDMWSDRTLYGRVDEHQDAVYMTNDNLQDKLKRLDVGVTPGTRPLYVLNFVSDAFTALRNYVMRANSAGKITPNTIFSQIPAARGYSNFTGFFDSHVGGVYSAFMQYLLAQNRKNEIVGFKDYVTYFVKFLDTYPGILPITRSGFITSKYCPPYVSGLIIDLYLADFNDDAKRAACVGDLNFTFFQRAANHYGFYIDKNAPWRLIANVSSRGMQNFMSPTPAFMSGPDKTGSGIDEPDYGLHFVPDTASNLFSSGKYFEKSYLTDVEMLKRSLGVMYNFFVDQNPYQVKTATCGAIKRTVLGDAGPSSQGGNLYKKNFTQRKKVTWEMIEGSYGGFEWINLYMDLRFLEQGIKLEPRRKKNVDKTLRKYYYRSGHNAALGYINNYVKKIPSVTAIPDQCQAFTFCQAEEEFKKTTPSNVKFIKDTSTMPPAPQGFPSAASMGGGSTSGY
jgi:hypothetical protein